jgi:hypothetical protein
VSCRSIFPETAGEATPPSPSEGSDIGAPEESDMDASDVSVRSPKRVAGVKPAPRQQACEACFAGTVLTPAAIA